MIYLRQSTASQEIALGPFLDPTDGDTEETGLTISAASIRLWKRGATTLVAKNSGGATHMEGGVYYATLDATDTNTAGSLIIFCHVEIDSNNINGALYTRLECEVLPATVYDSLVLGTDNLQVDVTQISGDTTAADNLELAVGTGFSSSTDTLEAIRNQVDYSYSVISHLLESRRGSHSFQAAQGQAFFVDPVNGDTHANGNRGGLNDPYNSVQDCHDNAVVDSRHDIIFLVSGQSGGTTTLTEALTISKRYLQIRGPGRDFIITRSTNGDTITVTADGVGIEGCQLNTHTAGSGNGITVSSCDFFRAEKLWVNDTRGDGISVSNSTNVIIRNNVFTQPGQSGSGNGVNITATSGQNSSYCQIKDNIFESVQGDAVLITPSGTGVVIDTIVSGNKIFGSTGSAVNVTTGTVDTQITDNRFSGNATNISDSGTDTVDQFNIEITPGEVWDVLQSSHTTAGTFGEVATEVASILVDTNELQTDWGDGGRLDTILDARASQSSVDTVDANVDTILVDTGTTIPAQITALNNVSVSDILTTQMTESYAADGVAPTIAQALFLIQQKLGDFGIAGTTLTVRQIDGATTAATFTLDDGTNPTSITRAT